MGKKSATVSARVGPKVKRFLQIMTEEGPYVSIGDYIRDAVREKAERETPEIWKRSIGE